MDFIKCSYLLSVILKVTSPVFFLDWIHFNFQEAHIFEEIITSLFLILYEEPRMITL